MKRVKVTVINHDENIQTCLYNGVIKDEAKVIRYYDVDGSLNELMFQNKDILEIKRQTKEVKTTLYLANVNAKAHVETLEGAFDIPIAVSKTIFKEELISVTYDTGEEIEIMIEFFKE